MTRLECRMISSSRAPYIVERPLVMRCREAAAARQALARIACEAVRHWFLCREETRSRTELSPSMLVRL